MVECEWVSGGMSVFGASVLKLIDGFWGLLMAVVAR